MFVGNLAGSLLLQNTYCYIAQMALSLLADKLLNIGSPDSISLEDFNQLVGLAQISNSYAKKHAELAEKTYQLIG